MVSSEVDIPLSNSAKRFGVVVGVNGVVSNLKLRPDDAEDRLPAISLDLIVAMYDPSVVKAPVKDSVVASAFSLLLSAPLK